MVTITNMTTSVDFVTRPFRAAVEVHKKHPNGRILRKTT